MEIYDVGNIHMSASRRTTEGTQIPAAALGAGKISNAEVISCINSLAVIGPPLSTYSSSLLVILAPSPDQIKCVPRVNSMFIYGWT